MVAFWATPGAARHSKWLRSCGIEGMAGTGGPCTIRAGVQFRSRGLGLGWGARLGGGLGGWAECWAGLVPELKMDVGPGMVLVTWLEWGCRAGLIVLRRDACAGAPGSEAVLVGV